MHFRDLARHAAEIEATRISVTPREADAWYEQFGGFPPANDNGSLFMEPEDVQEVIAVFMHLCIFEKIDPVYDDADASEVFSKVLARGGWHPALQLQMLDHVDTLWPRVAPHDPFDDFSDRPNDNVVMLGY